MADRRPPGSADHDAASGGTDRAGPQGRGGAGYRAGTTALRRETVSVMLSVGTFPDLDLAGMLVSLERHPYGSAEQITSRAMPLLQLGPVAAELGIASEEMVRNRVQRLIDRLMTVQRTDGAFAMWSAQGPAEMWLTAYVVDFGRARMGYRVPELPCGRGVAERDARQRVVRRGRTGGAGICALHPCGHQGGRCGRGALFPGNLVGGFADQACPSAGRQRAGAAWGWRAGGGCLQPARPEPGGAGGDEGLRLGPARSGRRSSPCWPRTTAATGSVWSARPAASHHAGRCGGDQHAGERC